VRTHRANGKGSECIWTWDGRDSAERRLPSGTYYYEVVGGDARWSGRWVILR
jgi:hypothetical protein